MKNQTRLVWAFSVMPSILSVLSILLSMGCSDDSSNGENENTNENQNQNQAVCGNGLIEHVEVCDGTNLGGLDCLTEGFDGGALACSTDCSELLTAGCCTNGCGPDGATACDGDILQTCEPHTAGCLDWTLLDCTDAGQICHDTGNEASCVGDCTSDCDSEGDHRCNGKVVEVCAVNGVCLNWAQETVCATNVGCDGGACRPDADTDGFSEFFGDCDDDDPDAYPDAPEIPGDGIDQNCDGPDGRVGIDQYVESTFAISAFAFAVSTCVSDATDNCYVYVERGTFELTAPFAIVNDSATFHEVGVIGGYDTDGLFLNRHFGDATPFWQGTFGAATEFATVVRYEAPTTEQHSVSLTGTHTDNLIWLNGLRLEGPAQSNPGGASVALSVFGANTAVQIDQCLLVGGTAGAGSAGANGGGGDNGNPGTGGGAGFWASMGATTAGSAGASTCGAAGHQGAWSQWYAAGCTVSFSQADVYHGTNGGNNTEAQPNCNDTTPPMHYGGTGSAGAGGTAGTCGSGGQAAAAAFGTLAAGLWSPPDAPTAGSAGSPGTGGYGGGSGGGYIGSCDAGLTLLGGAGGGGGAGGCAGEAGGAGENGGSCLGLLITDVDGSNIVLSDLTIHLGAAGAGGDGGSGGNGGNGGGGGNGGYGKQWGGGRVCSSGSGGTGGAGGPGGGSGGGGGGNGGNALGIGATVTIDDSQVTYFGGAAGTAGAGGAGGVSGAGGPSCSAAGGAGNDGQVLESKMDY